MKSVQSSVLPFRLSLASILFIWLWLPCLAGAEPGFYTPADWTHYGCGTAATAGDRLVLADGFAVSNRSFKEGEIRFEARAPQGSAQVQIWAGFACQDRDHRFAVALRGGNNNDLYLARYAPDGNDEFLGQAMLEHGPAVGEWHALRILLRDRRIMVFLDGESVPRLNLETAVAAAEGGVVLGGGWLPAEYRKLAIEPLTPKLVAEMDRIGRQALKPVPIDRAALRFRQRTGYRPLVVPAFPAERNEIALDGDWLFKPDQELAPGSQPAAPETDDLGWHVLAVPNMWTPLWAWLHGEKGGWAGDKSEPATKGISDRFRQQELDRVNGYTFDWQKTDGAWYRHHLELPATVTGKHLEIVFDAVAKISEIHVNGRQVGSHVGMFGEFRCDISQAVHPGRNLLAVHVMRNYPNREKGTRIEAVAVSVPVTSEMLRSLPHGMYNNDPGGIWQPVRLVVTNQLRINDLFIKPRLDGATFEVEVANGGTVPQNAVLSYAILDAADGSLLCQSPAAPAVPVPGSGKTLVNLEAAGLRPKLWSPASPNLYWLELEVRNAGQVVDRQRTRFGFRTFAVDKNRLMLNGQPVWLRGANHLPHPLRPNDRELALRMMDLARAGNVRFTRSHVGPMSRTWLDAADEAGMGISYEGNWPWLMLRGEVPDENLLKIWREEMAAMIHSHRNHPSLLIWTVNNEMKFYHEDRQDKARLQRKWTVVSDMIATMRQLDPTRPIVADSAYVRRENQADYDSLVKPNRFDDGDIDDVHRYPGWYNPSFMQMMDGQLGKRLATPNRPLISQELSTGYPQNDDGHPTRFYLFKHCTPQALVGLDAYEDRDPARFLERQAFMTKELAEALRRSNHEEMSGVMLFAYLSWFKDVYDAKRVAPWPTYYSVKTALQPVLVSAELFGRHFYAGQTVRRRVCIINDAEDGKALPPARLIWQIRQDKHVLATGQVEVPAVDYYNVRWMDVDLAMPSALSAGRVDAQLILKLEGPGGVISENAYDVLVAGRDWADGAIAAGLAQAILFDPAGKCQDLKMARLAALTDLPGRPEKLLIIATLDPVKTPEELAAIRRFAEAGGRILILQGGKTAASLLPEQIRGWQGRIGEIVTAHIPESPVFAGLEWRDLAWFELGPGNIPQACRGYYEVNRNRPEVTVLADHVGIHGYLQNPQDFSAIAGCPLLEVRLGKGRLILCEMCVDARTDDPVARRLLGNLVASLLEDDQGKGRP